MARKQAATATTTPQIFKATLGAGGEVVKGGQITQVQAAAERQGGRDVVVCGNDLAANRDLAKNIEHAANGTYKRVRPTRMPDRTPCRTTNRTRRHRRATLFTKQPTAKQNERCYEVLHA